MSGWRRQTKQTQGGSTGAILAQRTNVLLLKESVNAEQCGRYTCIYGNGVVMATTDLVVADVVKKSICPL